MSGDEQKPSDRIHDLHAINRSLNDPCVDDAFLLGLAIMNYLDEIHEKSRRGR